MTTRLVHLYTLNPIADEHEDVLIGRLLNESGESWELVELDNRKAFDYDEKNTDVWAWSHAVLEGAINPHKMKDDQTYLKVAAMYDSHGLRPDMEQSSSRTREDRDERKSMWNVWGYNTCTCQIVVAMSEEENSD